MVVHLALRSSNELISLGKRFRLVSVGAGNWGMFVVHDRDHHSCSSMCSMRRFKARHVTLFYSSHHARDWVTDIGRFVGFAEFELWLVLEQLHQPIGCVKSVKDLMRTEDMLVPYGE